jgi:hypothetical protein
MVFLDNCIRSLTIFYYSNNLRYYTESYYKASFIKVLDIIFIYAVFLNSFIYSLKPLSNNLRILLFYPLVYNPLIISYI